MRDRLIELIVDAENEICQEKPYFTDTERIDRVASHLLANGVIVPPCKVGQTIYYIHEGVDRVYEGEATSFVYVSDTNSFGIHYDGGYGVFGRYVFLTREEAEAALAEREGKG